MSPLLGSRGVADDLQFLPCVDALQDLVDLSEHRVFEKILRAVAALEDREPLRMTIPASLTLKGRSVPGRRHSAHKRHVITSAPQALRRRRALRRPRRMTGARALSASFTDGPSGNTSRTSGAITMTLAPFANRAAVRPRTAFEKSTRSYRVAVGGCSAALRVASKRLSQTEPQVCPSRTCASRGGLEHLSCRTRHKPSSESSSRGRLSSKGRNDGRERHSHPEALQKVVLVPCKRDEPAKRRECG